MSKIVDLTGQRFGKLTVIKRAEDFVQKSGRKVVKWECNCDCGNTVDVFPSNLINGKTKSCGCMALKDLTGQKFGGLTVLSRAESKKTPSGGSRTMWLCRCDCGRTSIVDASSLVRGGTVTCGKHQSEKNVLLHATHGMSKTRIYKEWICMKNRCYNPTSLDFDRYGGRGIIVCDEWKIDFMSFYKWAMDNGYRDDLTIDRVDVNGNYEPSNCRWITMEEQAKNKRNTYFIEYKGETKTLNEWSRDLGINRNTILARLEKYGWSIEDALTIPPKTRKGGKRGVNKEKASNRRCSHCQNYDKENSYCRLHEENKNYWSICTDFNWKDGI